MKTIKLPVSVHNQFDGYADVHDAAGTVVGIGLTRETATELARIINSHRALVGAVKVLVGRYSEDFVTGKTGMVSGSDVDSLRAALKLSGATP